MCYTQGLYVPCTVEEGMWKEGRTTQFRIVCGPCIVMYRCKRGKRVERDTQGGKRKVATLRIVDDVMIFATKKREMWMTH